MKRIMNQSSTVFLKFVLVLIAAIVLAFLLWFPTVEGRNVNADLFTIYFKDPFLAYVYLSSVPFFGALYQAFKLLGYIEKNKAFTQISVNALRNINYCATAIVCFVGALMPYMFFFTPRDEDNPGVVLIGFVIIFAAFVIATAAAVFQRLLQNAVDIKSENDLTV